MSSVRGSGGFRGRGRGSAESSSTTQRGRGWSARGRASSNNAQRGNTSNRGTFGEPSRANPSRGAQRSTRGHGRTTISQRGASDVAQARGSWQDRYQALVRAREKERSDAIQRGLIADPDNPRKLSEAITPIGTCQDMCAEFERVQRVVQKDVWDEELDPHHSPFATTDKDPDEARMVKKFRRAAAGLEEQLPSDLRPPHVLKRTCDYLFDEVIGNATSLAQVHHFVWDRTRAIRNDFSIQQVTRPEELLIAVDCYERIARFHILALHQLALPEKPYSKYDWQQEREQLDRTLLSLMQYYDDCHGRVPLPNEAEFRAYCVIFQLQDPTPDLEDRIQTWSKHIVQDGRVKRAVDLYMAACNVVDEQGPLQPRANHLIARQDWQRFWMLIASNEVSYLMACVAEIYFNLVRRMVLNALFRAFRARESQSTPDWTIDTLCDLLAFDDGDEVYIYCERFGFNFNEREDGQQYLDLASVRGRTLPEPSAGMPKQMKTKLVEDKRFGRTLPAVINGLSIQQAQDAGLVAEDEEVDEGMEDAAHEENEDVQDVSGMLGPREQAVDNEESLFIPEEQESETEKAPAVSQHGTDDQRTSIFGGGLAGATLASSKQTTFGQPSKFGGSSTFGKPSIFAGQASPFAEADNSASERMQSTANQGGKLNFGQPATTTSIDPATAATLSPFGTGNTFQPTQSQSLFKGSPFGQPSSPFSNHANATKSEQSVSLSKKPSSEPQFSFGQPSTTQNSFSTKSAFPTQSGPFSLSAGSKNGAGINVQSETDQETSTQSLLSPPSQETKSPAAEPPKVQSAFGSFTGSLGPEPSAPSLIQPSAISVSQPHFTSSPTSTITTSIAQATSNTSPPLGSGNRRASSSADTKPKKPSPLSNSITAGEENTAVRSEASVNVSFGSGAKQTQAPRQPQETATQAAAEEFNALVSRLTNELFDNPHDGYLKQYIDFVVNNTITEVNDQIIQERNDQEAIEYRNFRLCERYGRRWRDIFWQRRLAKTGRERRERRQRRLQQRGSQEVENSSLYGTESVLGSSRAASILEMREEMGNELSKKVLNAAGWVRPTTSERPSTTGSKRPISSHSADGAKLPRESGHKRLKSTSHVNEQGRITKPAPTSHPTTDILKRSSFLGFSMAKDGDVNSKNTTKSNYFRLKAMGVNQADKLSGLRGTKRANTESTQHTSPTSPPALRLSHLGFSPERPATKDLMPPPASKSPQTFRSNDDDEALFARIRNAREGLKQSVSFFQKEAANGENLQRSLSSVSSQDSTSMIQARADARLRASRIDSNHPRAGGDRPVPAFWMRESKFVPREQYVRAIERANEMRASRSRETSRPESRLEIEDAEQHSSIQPQPSPKIARPEKHNLSTMTFSAGPETRSLQAGNAQSGTSAFGMPSKPFDSHVSFSNHTTQMSFENPFLRATGPHTAMSFGSHPTIDRDYTIDPSQIHQSLATSFGSATGITQNSPDSVSQHGQASAQQDSYQHTQAVSLLSDDEHDSPAPPQLQKHYAPAKVGRAPGEALNEVAQDEHHRDLYYHGNSYLTQPGSITEDDNDQPEWDSNASQDGYESDGEANGYMFEEDEDAVDGDIDENETEEDGEREDDTESPDEDEDEDEAGYDAHKATPWQPSTFGQQWVQKNAALQEVGNSAEEAIELSD